VERAWRAVDTLMFAGFDESSFMVGDSGNGAHIVVACKLPNTTKPPKPPKPPKPDPSKDLVLRFLQALAAEHSDDAVEVDLTTFNAARISKVYGTPVRKGFSTTDRPHRVARILRASASMSITPVALIERIASRAPAPERESRKSYHYGNGKIDLRDAHR
jgi:hypothetical protein